MIKELFLSTIPDDFDPDKHIPVSPYCFIGKEQVFPGFDKLEFIKTVHDTGELIKFDEISGREALRLVNVIAEKYNPEQFRTRPFIFWKTIYYPWLGTIVPFLLRKQLLVKELFSKYGNEKVDVHLPNQTYKIRFIDDEDFIDRGVRSVNFHQWLLSNFIESNRPDAWSLIYDSDDNHFKEEPVLESVSFLRKMYAYADRILFRVNKVYGFSLLDRILFYLLIWLKPKVKRPPRNAEVVDNEPLIDWDIDIVDLIDSMIPDHYKNLPKKAGHLAKGRLLILSNKLYFDFESKIKAAFAYENENIVIATQHGGHQYGSALTANYDRNVEYLVDYFFTWGWNSYKRKELDSLVPLPSPLLSKLYNKHKPGKDKIILVGTDMLLTMFIFNSTIDEMHVLEYREKKKLLINQLLKTVDSKHFFYRPYPKRKGSYEDEKFFRAHFPDLQILNGNLMKEVNECALLILDHPGTTWNMAMAMNVPVICFWERKWFPFNEDAGVFLNRFHEVGLYFDKYENVVTKVDMLINSYSNISTWWNQPEIQKLRKEWMDKYARTDRHWFKVWTKTLWKLNDV